MATENKNEPNPWKKWGLFYYDPADPRIIVPKQIPIFGWTLNFASKISWVIMVGIVGLIAWAIYTGQAHVNMP